MPYCLYHLELEFSGPLLSQAVGTLSFGLDAAMQRYRGQPALGGAQIRGNIRHILEQWAHSDYVQYLDDWFPDEQSPGGTRRSRLNFDLFWQADCVPDNAGERVRIEIGDQGAVKRGSLQVIEDLFPSGSSVRFSGLIRARFTEKDEKACFEKWMDKALQWLDAVGSLKGVGYGRLTGFRLTPLDAPEAPTPALPPDHENRERIGLRLRLDRPFCLGRQQSANDNRIVSSDAIPGEVIKAIVAERHGERFPNSSLDDIGFDDMIINHARPARRDAATLPEVMPLNVAVVGGRVQTVTDAGTEWRGGQAPAFQPDWKSADWQQAERALGLASILPPRLLLVRTAIEPGANTAKESALFSLECVEPDNLDWLTDIDLSALDEPRRKCALERLPQLLGHEFGPIGKTGAMARVSLELPFSPPAAPSDKDSAWQLILQTSARLLPHDLQPGNVNTDQIMQQHYQDYFARHSDDSLMLISAFTTQTLYGGDYHFHRFQKKHHQPYRPEWRVEPGSVFIVKAAKGREETARETIARWARCNLPACETPDTPAHWEHTPSLPEHGYGEIRVKPLKHGGAQ